QEGEVTGAIETIRDITSLKKTERELFNSEQRYRSIIHDQTDYIARFTHDGTITFTNEAYRENFAAMLSLKDIEGKNIRDLMQIQNYPVVDAFLRSLSRDEPVREMEREFTGIDGEKHWQLWTVRALFDEHGIAAEYQVSGKDITRLKRDEEEIAFKNIILKTQQEASPDAILIVDSEGSILGYNKNFKILWEIPEDLLLAGEDEPVLRFVSMQSADPENFLSRVISLYENLNERSYEEIVLRNGSVIERYSSPMLDPDGTYLGRVWFFRDITARKRADDEIHSAYEELAASEESLQSSYRELLTSKEALQDSEFRLRSLIDNTEEAISMIDEEGRIIEWNQSSELISGISKEEALGMYMWDLIFRMAPLHHKNAEYRNNIKQAIQSSLKTGTPVFPGPEIIHATRPDGSKIITRQRIFSKKTDRGYQFGSISHDITDEKVVEEALMKSEERFREMAERSSDLIIILNKEMSPTYVSPSARIIVGYEPDEMVGKPPEFASSTIFSSSGPVLFNAVQKTMRGELVENVEIRVCKKDNTLIIASLSAVPMIHEGVVDGVQVSIRDITLGKKLEAALRESEERYRLLADNVHDIIWTIDETMNFTYLSPSVRTFLGLTQKEALESSIYDYLTPESCQELQRYKRLWVESIENGVQLPQNLELNLEFKRKDGSKVWTEIFMTMLYDNNQNFVGMVGVTRDINKRRQAEEALRIANRQLNLLSGITRHDILNKISVIISYLVLLEDYICDPEASGYLKKTESATRTIKSLIEFTRCYDDLGSTQPKWHNLNEVLDQIQFPNQIKLHTDLKGYFILADPMLEKVFYNLLDNSIRYGGSVSIIRVTAQRDGDDLMVVWEDDGVGIEEAEKEKIFERGFGKNTGLGMFLVRDILSLTGITIVENGKPGEGARFEIRVPSQSYRVTD
ncbi:MAG: PAS domain S-box protein, partial [Methanospirillum sp.]|uniref:PAS domain S-box protein n=1 Tax=Methanospirillum sp. TaxID=45200 RepID=UPI00236CC9C1